MFSAEALCIDDDKNWQMFCQVKLILGVLDFIIGLLNSILLWCDKEVVQDAQKLSKSNTKPCLHQTEFSSHFVLDAYWAGHQFLKVRTENLKVRTDPPKLKSKWLMVGPWQSRWCHDDFQKHITKKIFLLKPEASIAVWHHLSHMTILVANFGCDLFQFMPVIVPVFAHCHLNLLCLMIGFWADVLFMKVHQ